MIMTSTLMKIFLENRKRFFGTELSYPFLELGEPFHVYLKHCPCRNTFTVGYVIKNRFLKEGEEKKIQEICKSGKVKHKVSFFEPFNTIREVVFYDLPEKIDTFRLFN